MIWWYLRTADPVLAPLWRVSREKSTHEFINWEAKKGAWVREFHEKARIPKLRLLFTPAYDNPGQVWDTHGFDAIIGPGLASPALIHK